MSNPFGDIDAASSNPQVSPVYQPSAKNDAVGNKSTNEGHGGINSTVNVSQVNDVVSTTSHDNSSFRKELAGSL